MKILGNRQARRHLMALQGLSEPVNRIWHADHLHARIAQMGFVQVDSVNTVERAHHHILYARSTGYRPDHLKRLIEVDRRLFENWTHDASVIPVEFFPYWKHRFEREKERLRSRWKTQFERDGFDKELDSVRKRIAADGPVLSRDFEGDKPSTGWWDWHSSKAALEYLWRTGELAIARREGFQKVYDLVENVIPDAHRRSEVSREAFVDWACRTALERLGFATRGEIASFWSLLSPADVEEWLALQRIDLEHLAIEDATGQERRASVALPGTFEAAQAAPAPPGRTRILSPFDPLLRDRKRTERVFGFHYRIEIFVPEARRRFGYYVFPVMRGEDILGRIDMKADRARDVMVVRAFWPEPGVRIGRQMLAALEAEIERMRRLSCTSLTEFEPGWIREPV